MRCGDPSELWLCVVGRAVPAQRERCPAGRRDPAHAPVLHRAGAWRRLGRGRGLSQCHRRLRSVSIGGLGTIAGSGYRLLYRPGHRGQRGRRLVFDRRFGGRRWNRWWRRRGACGAGGRPTPARWGLGRGPGPPSCSARGRGGCWRTCRGHGATVQGTVDRRIVVTRVGTHEAKLPVLIARVREVGPVGRHPEGNPRRVSGRSRSRAAEPKPPGPDQRLGPVARLRRREVRPRSRPRVRQSSGDAGARIPAPCRLV